MARSRSDLDADAKKARVEPPTQVVGVRQVLRMYAIGDSGARGCSRARFNAQRCCSGDHSCEILRQEVWQLAQDNRALIQQVDLHKELVGGSSHEGRHVKEADVNTPEQ